LAFLGAASVGAASSTITEPPPQLPSAHPLVQSEHPLVQLEETGNGTGVDADQSKGDQRNERRK